MKKALSLLIALAMIVAIGVPMAFSADYPDTALVDDFNRADADKDIGGDSNSAGLGVWWQNWDNATIESNALKLTGEAHFGAGVNLPIAAAEGNYKYLVLKVKGTGVEGFKLAPGGAGVDLADLKGSLPELTSDYQLWVVDIDESGLTRDQGFHMNIAAGTLYVDEIYYTNTDPNAEEGNGEEGNGEENNGNEDPAPEYPAKALVDDFNRSNDDADLSGLDNSAGLGVWWQNWDHASIVNNALELKAVNDEGAHFGSGVNLPLAADEGNYKYLVLKVKGTGVEGFKLAPGGKGIDFADLKGTFPALSATDWQYWVVDIAASGYTRDQGFHMNIAAGTLYVDEIYYTNTAPSPINPATPSTGETPVVFIALGLLILAGGTAVALRKKHN